MSRFVLQINAAVVQNIVAFLTSLIQQRCNVLCNDAIDGMVCHSLLLNSLADVLQCRLKCGWQIGNGQNHGNAALNVAQFILFEGSAVVDP